VGSSGAVITKESEREREQGKGKENAPLTNSSSVARSESPYAPPISYATFRVHTTMQIPGSISMESEGEVEDEISSFKEVKGVQKKLVKEGNVEVVENPTFITETRRKELGRERLRDESTSTSIPVVNEEKSKFSLFPHPHYCRGESEAHIAAAIQQPVVGHEEEREREVMGTYAVPPPPFSFLQNYRLSYETEQLPY
jgi:hypothetical protein